MFLNNSQVTLPKDYKCMIPFGSNSPNGQLTDQTWFLGKSIMSSYYSIFDATQLEKNATSDDSYLRVGIGPRNPIDLIGYKEIEKHDKDQDRQ